MRKIYTIISPILTKSGDVCGYPIDHIVGFFDSLEEAIAHSEWTTSAQNAIIELNFDPEQHQITSFCKCYTVDAVLVRKSSRKDPSFFNSADDLPVWEDKVITPEELPPNALANMNKQYQIKNHELQQSGCVII